MCRSAFSRHQRHATTLILGDRHKNRVNWRNVIVSLDCSPLRKEFEVVSRTHSYKFAIPQRSILSSIAYFLLFIGWPKWTSPTNGSDRFFGWIIWISVPSFVTVFPEKFIKNKRKSCCRAKKKKCRRIREIPRPIFHFDYIFSGLIAQNKKTCRNWRAFNWFSFLKTLRRWKACTEGRESLTKDSGKETKEDERREKLRQLLLYKYNFLMFLRKL